VAPLGDNAVLEHGDKWLYRGWAILDTANHVLYRPGSALHLNETFVGHFGFPMLTKGGTNRKRRFAYLQNGAYEEAKLEGVLKKTQRGSEVSICPIFHV